MFWNDPVLYGANLPYKDFPLHTPFMGQLPPWQMQKFIPPYTPFIPPYLQTPFVPPFQAQQFPFVPPFQAQQFPFVPPFQAQQFPFVPPYQMNLPFFPMQRPVIY